MTIVYLGLFQKIFEWVMSNILDPVYRFVSNLLSTVFSWIFQEILAPVLMPVLEMALNFFIELWLSIYSTQLYLLFAGVLKLIDYLQIAFDVFIGLKDVTYTTPNGTVITGSLIEVLLQQETVGTVFWVITLGALGLALMLTIYATAKSAFDLDFENKRPVSKVLTAMMKTFIQFFTVPFLVYFLLKLAAVILRGVTSTLSGSGNTSLGRIVFTIASLDAAKNEAYNISTASSGITLGTSPQDIIRYPFYTMGGNGVSPKDYGNLSQVTDSFKLASFDYLIGFIAAIFLLFTIGICLIIFVQRIFELILLYIVSPYFVCLIPLDDGEKFGKWREMFVGKCFTGFGSAIGMRLFLMICPMVMGNRIQFTSGNSPEMDFMIKLFFIMGGAWAVYKSGSMLTSLLSSQAGMSESGTAAMAGGMLYGATAGMAMSLGKRAIGSALSGRGKSQAAGDAGQQGKAMANGKAAQSPRFTGITGKAARGVLKNRALNRVVGKSAGKIAAHMSSTANYARGIESGIQKRVGKIGQFADKIQAKVAPQKNQNFIRRRAGKVIGGIAGGVSRRVNNFNRNTSGVSRYFEGISKDMQTMKTASEGKGGISTLLDRENPWSASESAAGSGARTAAGGASGASTNKIQVQIGGHRLLNKESSVTADANGKVSSWKFATPSGRRADGAYYRPAARPTSATMSHPANGSTSHPASGPASRPASGPATSPAAPVKSASASVAGAEVKYSDISIKGVSADTMTTRVRRHSVSVTSSGSYQSSNGSGSGGDKIQVKIGKGTNNSATRRTMK